MDESSPHETYWIGKIEACVSQFMQKVFYQPTETEADESLTPSANEILREITEIMAFIVSDKLSLASSETMIENLAYMSIQDFSQIEKDDIVKIVQKFETSRPSFENIKLEVRIKNLEGYLKNMKNFSEYLLRKKNNVPVKFFGVSGKASETTGIEAGKNGDAYGHSRNLTSKVASTSLPDPDPLENDENQKPPVPKPRRKLLKMLPDYLIDSDMVLPTPEDSVTTIFKKIQAHRHSKLCPRGIACEDEQWLAGQSSGQKPRIGNLSGKPLNYDVQVAFTDENDPDRPASPSGINPNWEDSQEPSRLNLMDLPNQDQFISQDPSFQQPQASQPQPSSVSPQPSGQPPSTEMKQKALSTEIPAPSQFQSGQTQPRTEPGQESNPTQAQFQQGQTFQQQPFLQQPLPGQTENQFPANRTAKCGTTFEQQLAPLQMALQQQACLTGLQANAQCQLACKPKCQPQKCQLTCPPNCQTPCPLNPCPKPVKQCPLPKPTCKPLYNPPQQQKMCPLPQPFQYPQQQQQLSQFPQLQQQQNFFEQQSQYGQGQQQQLSQIKASSQYSQPQQPQYQQQQQSQYSDQGQASAQPQPQQYGNLPQPQQQPDFQQQQSEYAQQQQQPVQPQYTQKPQQYPQYAQQELSQYNQQQSQFPYQQQQQDGYLPFQSNQRDGLQFQNRFDTLGTCPRPPRTCNIQPSCRAPRPTCRPQPKKCKKPPPRQCPAQQPPLMYISTLKANSCKPQEPPCEKPRRKTSCKRRKPSCSRRQDYYADQGQFLYEDNKTQLQFQQQQQPFQDFATQNWGPQSQGFGQIQQYTGESNYFQQSMPGQMLGMSSLSQGPISLGGIAPIIARGLGGEQIYYNPLTLSLFVNENNGKNNGQTCKKPELQKKCSKPKKKAACLPVPRKTCAPTRPTCYSNLCKPKPMCRPQMYSQFPNQSYNYFGGFNKYEDYCPQDNPPLDTSEADRLRAEERQRKIDELLRAEQVALAEMERQAVLDAAAAAAAAAAAEEANRNRQKPKPEPDVGNNAAVLTPTATTPVLTPTTTAPALNNPKQLTETSEIAFDQDVELLPPVLLRESSQDLNPEDLQHFTVPYIYPNIDPELVKGPENEEPVFTFSELAQNYIPDSDRDIVPSLIVEYFTINPGSIREEARRSFGQGRASFQQSLDPAEATRLANVANGSLNFIPSPSTTNMGQGQPGFGPQGQGQGQPGFGPQGQGRGNSGGFGGQGQGVPQQQGSQRGAPAYPAPGATNMMTAGPNFVNGGTNPQQQGRPFAQGSQPGGSTDRPPGAPNMPPTPSSFLHQQGVPQPQGQGSNRPGNNLAPSPSVMMQGGQQPQQMGNRPPGALNTGPGASPMNMGGPQIQAGTNGQGQNGPSGGTGTSGQGQNSLQQQFDNAVMGQNNPSGNGQPESNQQGKPTRICGLGESGSQINIEVGNSSNAAYRRMLAENRCQARPSGYSVSTRAPQFKRRRARLRNCQKKECASGQEQQEACPMMVVGVGLERVPSVTKFHLRRELNIPGMKLFDLDRKCGQIPESCQYKSPAPREPLCNRPGFQRGLPKPRASAPPTLCETKGASRACRAGEYPISRSPTMDSATQCTAPGSATVDRPAQQQHNRYIPPKRTSYAQPGTGRRQVKPKPELTVRRVRDIACSTSETGQPPEDGEAEPFDNVYCEPKPANRSNPNRSNPNRSNPSRSNPYRSSSKRPTKPSRTKRRPKSGPSKPKPGYKSKSGKKCPEVCPAWCRKKSKNAKGANGESEDMSEEQYEDLPPEGEEIADEAVEEEKEPSYGNVPFDIPDDLPITPSQMFPQLQPMTSTIEMPPFDFELKPSVMLARSSIKVAPFEIPPRRATIKKSISSAPVVKSSKSKSLVPTKSKPSKPVLPSKSKPIVAAPTPSKQALPRVPTVQSRPFQIKPRTQEVPSKCLLTQETCGKPGYCRPQLDDCATPWANGPNFPRIPYPYGKSKCRGKSRKRAAFGGQQCIPMQPISDMACIMPPPYQTQQGFNASWQQQPFGGRSRPFPCGKKTRPPRDPKTLQCIEQQQVMIQELEQQLGIMQQIYQKQQGNLPQNATGVGSQQNLLRDLMQDTNAQRQITNNAYNQVPWTQQQSDPNNRQGLIQDAMLQQGISEQERFQMQQQNLTQQERQWRMQQEQLMRQQAGQMQQQQQQPNPLVPMSEFSTREAWRLQQQQQDLQSQRAQQVALPQFGPMGGWEPQGPQNQGQQYWPMETDSQTRMQQQQQQGQQYRPFESQSQMQLQQGQQQQYRPMGMESQSQSRLQQQGQQFGPRQGQQFGPYQGQQFGQPQGQQFGQPQGQQFGQPQVQQFGQPQGQKFRQPQNQQYQPQSMQQGPQGMMQPQNMPRSTNSQLFGEQQQQQWNSQQGNFQQPSGFPGGQQQYPANNNYCKLDSCPLVQCGPQSKCKLTLYLQEDPKNKPGWCKSTKPSQIPIYKATLPFSVDNAQCSTVQQCRPVTAKPRATSRSRSRC